MSKKLITMTIGELIKNQKYAVVDGPFGTQLHKSDYVKKGIPLIRVQNISESNTFDENNLVFVSEKTFKELDRSAVYPEDILFSKTGSVGRVCFLPKKLERGLLASSCAKISIDSEKIDPKYVAIFLVSSKGKHQIKNLAVGSTRQTINLTEIKSIKIPVLDENVQSNIVQIYSKFQELLIQRKQNLELLDKLLLSYFYELFGKSLERFDKVTILKNLILDKPQNGLFKKNNLYGDGTKIVWVENVSKNGILKTSDLKRVKLNSDEINKYKLCKNDVIITRSSHLGKSGVGLMNVVQESDENVVFESHIMKIKLNTQKINPYFLSVYFNSSLGRARIEQKATQATMSTINQPNLLSLKVPDISITEQNKFEKFVKQIYSLHVNQPESLDEMKLAQKNTMEYFFKNVS